MHKINCEYSFLKSLKLLMLQICQTMTQNRQKYVGFFLLNRCYVYWVVGFRFIIIIIMYFILHYSLHFVIILIHYTTVFFETFFPILLSFFVKNLVLVYINI